MSFDQRPARATKRVVTPTAVAVPRPKVQSQATVPSKRGTKAIMVFVAAVMVGGVATTAGFYGLIPGIPAFALARIWQQ